MPKSRYTPKPLPSTEYLRECFNYDPETGVLTWRRRPREHFPDDGVWKNWNARFPGKIAGTDHSKGYRSVCISLTHYLVHRIIFKWMTGQEPPLTLDHKDGDRSDDRWEQLRPASYSQQMQNKKRPSNNTSGHKGVHRSPTKSERWFARVTINGVRHHRGSFATREEAAAAYEAAARELFGEFKRDHAAEISTQEPTEDASMKKQ